MWPFKRKPEAPKPEPVFNLGDRVRLVDGPRWTNPTNRHVIGREATIVSLPKGGHWEHPMHRGCWIYGDQYGLDVQGFGELWVARENMVKIGDGPAPFAEPRDMKDDEPNKVVRWDAVPWKPKVEVER